VDIELHQSETLVGQLLRLRLDKGALFLSPMFRSDTRVARKTERENVTRRALKSGDSRVAAPWERERA